MIMISQVIKPTTTSAVVMRVNPTKSSPAEVVEIIGIGIMFFQAEEGKRDSH